MNQTLVRYIIYGGEIELNILDVHLSLFFALYNALLNLEVEKTLTSHTVW